MYRQGVARFYAWSAFLCVLWSGQGEPEDCQGNLCLELVLRQMPRMETDEGLKWLCYNRDFNIIWRGS
jgi:hypothetical protein